jgi:hypothetical protein
MFEFDLAAREGEARRCVRQGVLDSRGVSIEQAGRVYWPRETIHRDMDGPPRWLRGAL